MELKDRILLFSLVCIPVRLFLAWLSYRYTPVFPLISALIGFAAGIGFIYQDRFGKNEGFFGGKVTWSRPVHAGFFLLFGAVSLWRPSRAYAVLLGDVAFGAATYYLSHVM